MIATRLIRTSLAVGIVVCAAAAYLGYDLYAYRTATLQAAEELARREASRAAAEIGAELDRVSSVLDGLRRQLGEQPSSDEIRLRFRALVTNEEAFASAGIVYRETLTGEGAVHTGGEIELQPLTDGIDGSLTDCLGQVFGEGSGWTNPSYDEASGETVVAYRAPLPAGRTGQPDAALYACIRLNDFGQQVAALDVGRTGWGFVVSNEGEIVIHPDERLLRAGVNILDVAEQDQDESLQAAAEQVLAGGSGVLEMDNRTTGQSSWYAYEPIPAADWTMVVVRIKDEIAIDQQRLRRQTIWISVAAVVGLTCLGFWLAAGAYRRNPRRGLLWSYVLFVSVLLGGGMATIRHLTYEQVTEDGRERVEIVDGVGLQSFLNSMDDEHDGERRHRVPSGVFIRELKFGEPKELFVKGILWQRFEGGVHEGFTPGFVLPDAIDLDTAEAYRKSDGQSLTIGWEFQGTVRQDMSQSRFPFDHERLSIRLLPTSFDAGTVLVPDLGSYSAINPAALPGLDENVVLSGWRISKSFFDYKIANYSTDFGLGRVRSTQPIPELHFNVSVKRNLVDAAVGYGIPLIIVVIMLFTIIASATKDVEQSKLAGFGPSSVMKVCSALFFAVLLAHIQLRDTVQVGEIVFLEYIYFTVYLALLFTAIHTFLFLLKRFQVPIIEYEDSLIIKLLFWPTILGLQFAITAVFFY